MLAGFTGVGVVLFGCSFTIHSLTQNLLVATVNEVTIISFFLFERFHSCFQFGLVGLWAMGIISCEFYDRTIFNGAYNECQTEREETKYEQKYVRKGTGIIILKCEIVDLL